MRYARSREREARLAAIAEMKKKLEARVAEQDEAQHQQRLAARAERTMHNIFAKLQTTGGKIR